MKEIENWKNSEKSKLRKALEINISDFKAKL